MLRRELACWYVGGGVRGEYRAEAAVGEVVRVHLVNTANTRIFNFGLSGARMKLVGGDSGRVEREEFIDEILLVTIRARDCRCLVRPAG